MAIRRGSLRLERNGMWTARVCVDGKTLRRYTGTSVRSEAEQSLARLAVIAECGRRRTIECAALLKAWPRYEASSVAAQLAPASRRTKYRIWLHFSVWMHGAYPEVREPHEVTRSMAEEYLAFFQGGHAPVTCNLRICYLREMFRFMLGGKDADAINPWSGIRLRASDGYTRRELSIDEVRRLLAVSESFGREWRMLFSLAIYTGMRLGDCACLLWDAVNLTSSIIQIVPRKTRRYMAGRPITIPLHPELMDMLKKTPPDERSGFVLVKIAQDFTHRRWMVSRRLESIFSKADIETSVLLEGRERRTPSATFHSLRHTFVSIAVNAGVPLATVQSIVGHTSTAMTRHYYHPNEIALRQAVNAIPPIMKGAKMPRSAVAALPSQFCSRLREIEHAKRRGLITGQEFCELRSRILAEV